MPLSANVFGSDSGSHTAFPSITPEHGAAVPVLWATARLTSESSLCKGSLQDESPA